MAVSPHIRDLRAKVGNDLLLLPSVAVLPTDTEGRALLVRQTDSGRWATIGGSVDVDESPDAAAVREAREEVGIEVELTEILGVLGGPEFRLTYPNGDQCAYVSIVYAARVVGGELQPDGDETDAVKWFSRDELVGPELAPFTQATFRALGWLTGDNE